MLQTPTKHLDVGMVKSHGRPICDLYDTLLLIVMSSIINGQFEYVLGVSRSHPSIWIRLGCLDHSNPIDLIQIEFLYYEISK